MAACNFSKDSRTVLRRLALSALDTSRRRRFTDATRTAVWFAAAAVLLLSFACRNQKIASPPITPQAFAAGKTYATQFPAAENPISENGMWISGKTRGLDWADVAVTPGLAFGVQTGSDGFDDSTALLTGTWTPDQLAQATVRCVNPGDDIYEEVELRLRSALSAHNATGYEINFRCSKTPDAYAEIVRWNGPLGKFTYLTRGRGATYGVADADTVTATAVGRLITAYINGVPVLQASDSAYETGNPGMGFFLRGPAGRNRDYGFTSFRASNAP